MVSHHLTNQKKNISFSKNIMNKLKWFEKIQEGKKEQIQWGEKKRLSQKYLKY